MSFKYIDMNRCFSFFFFYPGSIARQVYFFWRFVSLYGWKQKVAKPLLLRGGFVQHSRLRFQTGKFYSLIMKRSCKCRQIQFPGTNLRFRGFKRIELGHKRVQFFMIYFFFIDQIKVGVAAWTVVQLFLFHQAHERGIQPKGIINCAGYKALNNMDEYLELLNSSMPGKNHT